MATYLVQTAQPAFLPTRASDGTQLPGMVDYTDQDYRRIFQDALGSAGGIINVGDLAVTQTGTPDGQVHVGTGRYRVPGTNTASEGIYMGGVDTAVALDVYPSDVSRDRIDLVILQIVNDDGTSTWQGQLTWVQGSYPVSGPPTAPAAPADAIPVGEVYVAAGSSTYATAAITNVATVIGKDALNKCKARFYASGDTLCNPSVITQIKLDTVDYDDNSNVSTSSYNWKCPQSGAYLITGRAGIEDNANTTQDFLVMVYKNGSEAFRGYTTKTGSAANGWSYGGGVSDIQKLTAGDVIDMRGFVTSTNGCDVQSGKTSCYLSIHRLS